MHHRISTTLHALRQDLAARLGDDVILAACRAAGHTWRAIRVRPSLGAIRVGPFGSDLGHSAG
jgi:hypothetical protein